MYYIHALFFVKFIGFFFLFYCSLFVATLALGSRPRQGLTKVWAKSEAQESHFMLLGGQEYGRVEELNLGTPK
jgi:hypothetical protein